MITGIIMAAGNSSRFGKNKLLLEEDGEFLIERVLKVAKASKLDRIILIYKDKRVGKIGRDYGIDIVYNPRSFLGQSESLKSGVRYGNRESDYMFFVGDQPFLTVETVDKLIDAYFDNKDKIIVPSYQGKNGMPTIFPSKYRKELLSIDGDVGGKNLIKKYGNRVFKVFIEDEIEKIDIDCRDDMERYFKCIK